MKIGIIGRSEWTFESMRRAEEEGHEITFIITSKEAPEYKYSSEHFKQFAIERDIPFLYEPKITVQKLKPLVKNNHPDICISVNYSGIISQPIIEMFQLGILNAHGGDLPRYRGNACQAWAIINGEDRIGLCIHKMIGGELDSGDIITRDYLPIDRNVKITRVWEWMVQRIPELMIEAINRLVKNPKYVLECQSKKPNNTLRCYPRKPEDGRIEWGKSAIDVLRLINASNKPYAGAFCTLEGEKLIIWDAELVDDGEIFCAVPGQVTKIEEGFVEVACGKGKLKLLKVEYIKQTTEPSYFINSIRMRFK